MELDVQFMRSFRHWPVLSLSNGPFGIFAAMDVTGAPAAASAGDWPRLFLYAGIIIAAIVSIAFAWASSRRRRRALANLSLVARALAQGERVTWIGEPIGSELVNLANDLNRAVEAVSARLADGAHERDDLLAILSSINQGVIATDARQQIVFVNPRAPELFDFDAEGARGKHLWEVLRSEPILRAAAQVFEGGGVEAFQVSQHAGRHLEVSAIRIPASGPARGLVIVAHDTTRSVRYQELRKEFVANVSHELRTPLTVIKGFTETLMDGALNDQRRGPEFLAKIGKHVDQLTNLVDDLLELSRLESSPELPRPQQVDIGAVVRKTAELLLPAAQKKKQTLTVEAGAHLPRLWGNPDFLGRAVGNLVDNAIKYTPEEGTIAVCASIGNDGSEIIVDVSDNGIGIPQEELARVFERFYRVDRSRSREMGGTGLGLSIVKHVAQVHGGTIDVHSNPGTGSRFRLKFPVPAE